jgi:hypothetical protein
MILRRDLLQAIVVSALIFVTRQALLPGGTSGGPPEPMSIDWPQPAGSPIHPIFATSVKLSGLSRGPKKRTPEQRAT